LDQKEHITNFVKYLAAYAYICLINGRNEETHSKSTENCCITFFVKVFNPPLYIPYTVLVLWL